MLVDLEGRGGGSARTANVEMLRAGSGGAGGRTLVSDLLRGGGGGGMRLVAWVAALGGLELITSPNEMASLDDEAGVSKTGTGRGGKTCILGI